VSNKTKYLLILLAGVGFVVLLGFLPKYVVSDKEKRIKETQSQVKEQVKANQHQGKKNLDLAGAQRLKLLLQNAKGLQKLVFVDSLAKMYKDAFMLDSAAQIYFNYGSLNKLYYVSAIRDGLTGWQMTNEAKDKEKFSALCLKIADKGLNEYPDFLPLQVEKLRFEVFRSAQEGRPPVEFVAKLKTLAKENPSLISAKIALAEFYASALKVEQAIDYYQQVVAIDEQNVQAHLELVNLYLQQENKNLAKVHVTKLMELNKEDKDSYIDEFIQNSLKKVEH
jgi:tetratricopeptide (TPR) repeat protein